ncbi:MAG TPA: calcium-binding protein, partial [Stellaceae bacterium]|nr:calcium-binding protein [Stellaceae bacterium]
WAGGSTSTNIAALLAIEDRNTRDAASIILAPSPGHPVNVTPFAPGAPAPPNIGTNGKDIMIGGPGGALLNGRGGNDLIRAGRGGDTLIGGPGNDTLFGGPGHDCFVFNAALSDRTNVEQIHNFNPEFDLIALSHRIFARVNAAGPLSPSMFIEGAHADTPQDRVIYNPHNGWLIYDSNGNAPGGATHFATLAPHLLLSSGDFLAIG